MLKTIIESWPIIVTTAGLLFWMFRIYGKLLSMVKTICDRLDGHDKLHETAALKMNEVGQSFKEIGQSMATFTTIAMCDRCRDACERRNLAQFVEIKGILNEINEKRDDYVAALGDVSCRLGRIEGKLNG